MSLDPISYISTHIMGLNPTVGVQVRTGCGEDCLNRHSYIHCVQKMCPAGAACSNQPFHKLRPPRMEAFLTGNGRGWGVRAAQPVSKGDFIVEYAGATPVCCEVFAAR